MGKLMKWQELNADVQKLVESHAKAVNDILIAQDIDELVLLDGQTFKRSPVK
jgi:hypothetical protein